MCIVRSSRRWRRRTMTRDLTSAASKAGFSIPTCMARLMRMPSFALRIDGVGGTPQNIAFSMPKSNECPKSSGNGATRQNRDNFASHFRRHLSHSSEVKGDHDPARAGSATMTSDHCSTLWVLLVGGAKSGFAVAPETRLPEGCRLLSVSFVRRLNRHQREAKLSDADCMKLYSAWNRLRLDRL